MAAEFVLDENWICKDVAHPTMKVDNLYLNKDKIVSIIV